MEIFMWTFFEHGREDGYSDQDEKGSQTGFATADFSKDEGLPHISLYDIFSELLSNNWKTGMGKRVIGNDWWEGPEK